MDPKPNDETTVANVPVSIVASKRKRGRPRKVQVPSSAMMMFETVGLDEIRSALAHSNEPPIVDVVVAIDPAEDTGTPSIEDPVDPSVPLALPVPNVLDTSPTPIVKKRGRPRKHPLPNPDDPPKIKRKRGRPPKPKLPPSEEFIAMEMDPIGENGTHTTIPAVMYVSPPEVVPEPAQVRIAQIPVSPETSHDEIEEETQLASAKPQEVPTLEGPVKKKPGRPRKNPLPGENTANRPRGRPKKIPATADTKIDAPVSAEASDAPPTSEEVPSVKKARGRPRKHPLPTGPVEKRGRGRPRKNPLPDEPGKKKRGRPKKNASTIAEQSSESLLTTLSSQTSEIENTSPPLNESNDDQSKLGTEGFNLILSSESDNDGYTVKNATEMLEKHSKDTSPLLDDRFVESSDEDD